MSYTKGQQEQIDAIINAYIAGYVPQARAGKMMGKSSSWPGYLISAGHIKPVMVNDERWVSLADLRAYNALPKSNAKKPKKRKRRKK